MEFVYYTIILARLCVWNKSIELMLSPQQTQLQGWIEIYWNFTSNSLQKREEKYILRDFAPRLYCHKRKIHSGKLWPLTSSWKLARNFFPHWIFLIESTRRLHWICILLNLHIYLMVQIMLKWNVNARGVGEYFWMLHSLLSLSLV